MGAVGEGHSADQPTTGRRVTVAEAADVLGITVEAVRGRIKRGTIAHEREGERVFVLLDTDQTSASRDQGRDQTSDRPELVEELRARIEDLRADRDAWREQARRSDYLLGTSMERTRELEDRLRELEAPPQPSTPSETRESPESSGPTPAPTDAGEAPQTGTRRPWWRRVFGG